MCPNLCRSLVADALRRQSPPDWSSEATALATQLLSSQPPSAYSALASELHRRHDYWQKRLVPLLAADHIRQLDGANRLLDQLVPYANQHEIHRELGQTPHQALQ